MFANVRPTEVQSCISMRARCPFRKSLVSYKPGGLKVSCPVREGSSYHTSVRAKKIRNLVQRRPMRWTRRECVEVGSREFAAPSQMWDFRPSRLTLSAKAPASQSKPPLAEAESLRYRSPGQTNASSTSVCAGLGTSRKNHAAEGIAHHRRGS